MPKELLPEEQRLFRDFLREVRAESQKELREERIALLSGDVTLDKHDDVATQLISFAASSDERILLLINSEGGEYESCMGLVNLIEALGAPVWTLNTGFAFSGGCLVFLAGQKGYRFATRRGKFMLHKAEISLGRQPYDDFMREVGFSKTLELEWERYIASRSRLSITAVRTEISRCRYFDAAEAVSLGLADKILETWDDLWL